MEYLSVVEIAKKWGISERSVRNYCALGKIKGAFITGKTWNIPANSIKPSREKKSLKTDNLLLNIFREQKSIKLNGGIYHKTQVELTYNSNHIEGSKLSEEQTRYIFETNTIGVTNASVDVDDIIETVNHFKCIDYCIDIAKKELNEKIIKQLHFMLKIGTIDSEKDWFNVGEYKKLPNEVGGKETTLPENVKKEMLKLIKDYNMKVNEYKTKVNMPEYINNNLDNLKDEILLLIIDFHQKFESIHPFQDGNGRVGRLIMFKECLNNNVVPFIISNDIKQFYYRGLSKWKHEKGYLIGTILSAQDIYKKYLDYFKIKY